jgi:hypothetical protein
MQEEYNYYQKLKKGIVLRYMIKKIVHYYDQEHLYSKHKGLNII